MKIAIVGAHGVGKTSLSQALAAALNLSIIPDIVVQEAIQKGFTINENTPLETQFWLFARQLELEKTAGDSWVADKCLIDYSVYGDIVLRDERAKSLLADMIKLNARYDYLIYLPIEFPLEDNKIRSLDPNFQRAVDEHYREILDNWNLRYHIVSGSIAERCAQALAVIRR